jgi:hypothetical protein
LRLLDLLGEQSLAAGLRERTVADRIARGADDSERDGIGGKAVDRREAGAYLIRLRERERAAARSDAQQDALRPLRRWREGLHAVTSQ